ncbi:unnamed protein product, partial [Ectocarpus sp. 8 AP-2014]
MRRLLLVAALQSSTANASAVWAAHGLSPAVAASRKPLGSVNAAAVPGHLVRPTSTEEPTAGLSLPTRACRGLRGGCSGPTSSAAGAVNDGMKGEVRESSSSSGNEAAGDGAGGIDEDLYSRQLYVMGKTAMAKMGKADVLISGMRYVVCNLISTTTKGETVAVRPSGCAHVSSQGCLNLPPPCAKRG